jgi:hypothetical protein
MKGRDAAKRDCGSKSAPGKVEYWLDIYKTQMTELSLSVFHPVKEGSFKKLVAHVELEHLGRGLR